MKPHYKFVRWTLAVDPETFHLYKFAAYSCGKVDFWMGQEVPVYVFIGKGILVS